MAIVEPTQVMDDDGVVKITWANMKNGDTGNWVRAARFNDKTVQVIVNAAGTGDAVTMEGSPDDGTTVGDLHDAQGGLLVSALVGATITDPEIVAESPESIRPNVTAGDGTTDLTVVITAPSRGK